LFCYVQMQRADLQYWRKYHGLLSYWCYWSLLWFANAWRASVVATLYLTRRSRNCETRLRLKRHLACVRHLYINKYPSDSQ
jgi:hypothetical protein